METSKYTSAQLEESLKEILNTQGITLADVPLNRKYWFVRTYGGKYFNEFLRNKNIGIGWKWEWTYDPKGEIANSLRNGTWDILSEGLYSRITPYDDVSIDRFTRRIKSLFSDPKKKKSEQLKKDFAILEKVPEGTQEYVKKCITHLSLQKIIRFERGMSVGDVIIIPSHLSL